MTTLIDRTLPEYRELQYEVTLIAWGACGETWASYTLCLEDLRYGKSKRKRFTDALYDIYCLDITLGKRQFDSIRTATDCLFAAGKRAGNSGWRGMNCHSCKCLISQYIEGHNYIEQTSGGQDACACETCVGAREILKQDRDAS